MACDWDDRASRQLRAIADILGVSVAALAAPVGRDRITELLDLWYALPGEAERDAAIAYLHTLSGRVPRSTG